MDLILTPLVTRLLKQYVRRSSEGAGRDLKVRLRRRRGRERLAAPNSACRAPAS